MIDIHSHVVFNVDDGSESLEMSREMLRRSAEQGVTDVICTSHVTPGYHPFPSDQYTGNLQILQDDVKNKGIDIKLHSGCEIMYTSEAARMLREGEILTLAGSSYILVEFMPDVLWSVIQDAVREFASAGLTVIAAHVERYACLYSDLSRLEELHSLGVLCQMNGRTVLRAKRFMGDKWARKALSAGLIDLVASDMHNTTSRAQNLGEADRFLRKEFGDETANLLLKENPGRILHANA